MSQAKIGIAVSAFLETIDDDGAGAIGRGLALLLKRFSQLGDAVILPDGITTDLDGLAAMFGIGHEGARVMMDRNNVPYTKPGVSRLYAADTASQRFAAEADEK